MLEGKGIHRICLIMTMNKTTNWIFMFQMTTCMLKQFVLERMQNWQHYWFKSFQNFIKLSWPSSSGSSRFLSAQILWASPRWTPATFPWCLPLTSFDVPPRIQLSSWKTPGKRWLLSRHWYIILIHPLWKDSHRMYDTKIKFKTLKQKWIEEGDLTNFNS